jgi:hypothetical protein
VTIFSAELLVVPSACNVSEWLLVLLEAFILLIVCAELEIFPVPDSANIALVLKTRVKPKKNKNPKKIFRFVIAPPFIFESEFRLNDLFLILFKYIPDSVEPKKKNND